VDCDGRVENKGPTNIRDATTQPPTRSVSVIRFSNRDFSVKGVASQAVAAIGASVVAAGSPRTLDFYQNNRAGAQIRVSGTDTRRNPDFQSANPSAVAATKTMPSSKVKRLHFLATLPLVYTPQDLKVLLKTLPGPRAAHIQEVGWVEPLARRGAWPGDVVNRLRRFGGMGAATHIAVYSKGEQIAFPWQSKMLRLQFRIRTFQIALAIIAVLVVGLRRRHEFFQDKAGLYQLCEDTCRYGTSTRPRQTSSTIYFTRLRQKYQLAAAYPWLPVLPDPPLPPE